MRMQRLGRAWIVGLVLLGVSCRVGPSYREVRKDDWDVVFRVPEGIYSMTSSPDGALFVVAFSGGGPIYRSEPGRDTEWSKVIITQQGQPIFRTIYAPTSTTVFGFGDGHLLRWDEGKGITDFGTRGRAKWCGDYASGGSGVTALWGRGDRDVFAVGARGTILHYNGVEWTPMRNPISDVITDECTAPATSTLWSVGGNEHDVFAAGLRYLRLSANGRWTDIEQVRGVDDSVSSHGIAAQGATVFFGGIRSIRTDKNSPRLYPRAGVLAFSGNGLRALTGYDNVVGMNGGGALPGSAAVFWSFDNDLLIIDGSAVRVLRLRDFRTVRGAVAMGHRIYVAGLPRDNEEDVVVRLR
ncbi:MAG TPA: hypothetical protein VJW73_03240 [Gemmatimonadaceae bacterium]|nr:hypothetical protein [Gemmatimonadaceae bacterium]